MRKHRPDLPVIAALILAPEHAHLGAGNQRIITRVRRHLADVSALQQRHRLEPDIVLCRAELAEDGLVGQFRVQRAWRVQHTAMARGKQTMIRSQPAWRAGLPLRVGTHGEPIILKGNVMGALAVDDVGLRLPGRDQFAQPFRRVKGVIIYGDDGGCRELLPGGQQLGVRAYVTAIADFKTLSLQSQEVVRQITSANPGAIGQNICFSMA